MPERKIEYEKLDQKLHLGFRVKAPSWERLYVDAGLAMTDLIARLDLVEPVERKVITAVGDSKETLMVHWLSEVLSLFERERFVSRRIVFDIFDGKKIKATLTGESYDPARHGGVARPASVQAEGLEIGDAAVPEPHFFAKVFLKS